MLSHPYRRLPHTSLFCTLSPIVLYDGCIVPLHYPYIHTIANQELEMLQATSAAEVGDLTQQLASATTLIASTQQEIDSLKVF